MSVVFFFFLTQAVQVGVDVGILWLWFGFCVHCLCVCLSCAGFFPRSRSLFMSVRLCFPLFSFCARARCGACVCFSFFLFFARASVVRECVCLWFCLGARAYCVVCMSAYRVCVCCVWFTLFLLLIFFTCDVCVCKISRFFPHPRCFLRASAWRTSVCVFLWFFGALARAV